MVSSFYSSNQSKERAYVDENKIRMLNDEAQQQIVDAEIEKELGIERTSTNLSKLASRIFKKIITADKPEVVKSKFSDSKDNRYIDENALMASEDINYALKPLPSTPITPAQLEAQAKAQANLDLISLFQQDVKEARKKQALRDLDELNEMEDLRLRNNYMKVLQELKSEISSKSAREQSKKQFQEDKMVLDKMMQLIENQRMHDSFMEFSNLSIRDALASKIQRNLKSALNYKKSMSEVNKFLKKERIGAASEKVLKSQVGKTMNDMINTLEKNILTERRNKNMSSYFKKQEDDFFDDIQSITSASTVAPQIDMRVYNKGRPSKSVQEKYKEMMEIMSKPVNSRSAQEKKKLSNYKGIINKDRDVMLTMRDMINKIEKNN